MACSFSRSCVLISNPLARLPLLLCFALPAAATTTKMFFSREAELRAFKLLAERGFGPDLLATLGDGRVEQFLEGRVRRCRSTQPYQKQNSRYESIREAHFLALCRSSLMTVFCGGARFSVTEMVNTSHCTVP